MTGCVTEGVTAQGRAPNTNRCSCHDAVSRTDLWSCADNSRQPETMSVITAFPRNAGSHLHLGDHAIYYEVAGTAQRHALVLVHGGLGNLTEFNSIAGELAKDFSLVGIDLRGHGRSTMGSAPLTYEGMQQDVVAVLEHLKLHTFSLLGFSEGGIVGYRLAAQLQSQIKALVTVGAQWRLSPSYQVCAMTRVPTAEMWEGVFPGSRAYYESVNRSADFSRLVGSAVALWTDLGPAGYPAGSVKDITTPTLIVRGDNDLLLSLDEAASLRSNLPTASFLNVPFAGHEVHKDSPRLFLAVIKDFLADPRTPPVEA